METFISEGQLAEQRKRARRCTLFFRALLAGGLALFVILCLITRTANARAVFMIMLISMTLLGWICIGYYTGRVRTVRAEARHLETLTCDKPEEYEGELHVSAAAVQIPKSIRVRTVTLGNGENTKRLHLDDRLTERMPAEGSRVRVRAVHDFVTGIEILDAGEEGQRMTGTGSAERIRRLWRRAAYLIPLCIVWALLAAVIGGFVFNRITDTRPRNKIEIYADCSVRNAAELADMLEKEMNEPVRMVKVRSFDYSLFRTDIEKADIYIVAASHTEKYRRLFIPLPEDMRDAEDLLILDGEPYGIPFYTPDGTARAAADWFEYDSAETYYLFFGKETLHLAGQEGAADDQAADAARILIDTD